MQERKVVEVLFCLWCCARDIIHPEAFLSFYHLKPTTFLLNYNSFNGRLCFHLSFSLSLCTFWKFLVSCKCRKMAGILKDHKDHPWSTWMKFLHSLLVSTLLSWARNIQFLCASLPSTTVINIFKMQIDWDVRELQRLARRSNFVYFSLRHIVRRTCDNPSWLS